MPDSRMEEIAGRRVGVRVRERLALFTSSLRVRVYLFAAGSLGLVWGVAVLEGLERGLAVFGLALPLMASALLLLLTWHLLRGLAMREQALRESGVNAERFIKLFFASPTAYVLTSAQTGRYLEVNPASEALMGYSAAEAIGKTALELDVYADVAERDELLERLRRGDPVTGFPCRLRTRAGRVFPARQSVVKVDSPEGAYILSAILDCSHEAALAESEERFSKMFQASSTAYILLKPESGDYVAVNAAFERLTGYSASETIGKNSRTLGTYHDPAQRIEMARLFALSGNQHISGMRCDIRHKSGRVIPVRQWWTAAEVGGVPHVLATAVDITGEVALAESEARFRSLTQLSTDWYWEQDEHFRYTRFEGGETSRSVVAPSAELGKTRWELGFDNVTDAEWDEHKRLLAAHLPFREFVGIRHGPAGELLNAGSASGEPIFDEHGGFRGYRGIGRDVTHTVRLEAQMRQNQKMEAIGTLASGVAHDFNNILGTILGNAELARQDVGADHPASVSLEEIRKASLRAKGVVQQILAFSRDTKPEYGVLRLQDVLADDINLLRAALPASVRIVTAIEPEVPPVLADPAQIHQVLMNLCTNAWHAMPGAQGQIELTLEAIEVDAAAAQRLTGLAAGLHARLSLSDNGTGMSAATVQRIFEPFFTTRSQGQGTGLGLAVVHGIVKGHGGAIDVLSVPQRGTTFHLYFPAQTAKAPVAPAPAPAATAAATVRGGRVLYVDDEASLVFLVKRLLGRLGYHVTGADSAEAAWQALSADPDGFDLVLTDQNMPGMSGVEFAARVRAAWPGVPVVLASGLVTDELRSRAEAAGVVEVIYKPNTVEDLCAAVQRVIAARPAR